MMINMKILLFEFAALYLGLWKSLYLLFSKI